jgi:ParB-like chromosome segregation protein Spo0J
MSDFQWQPIKILLWLIIPWQDIPRMSTKAQAQRLIKSERELGQIQTLAVSPFTDDGRVFLFDGHQRVAAWMTVKDPSYEVTALQSNRMLTDDERKKVSVLLHTATGSWSWEALSSWSAADLREWGMDEDTLKGWNNDANNLKEMLNAGQDEPQDAEPQIDRAAELQEKWHFTSLERIFFEEKIYKELEKKHEDWEKVLLAIQKGFDPFKN